MKRIIILLLLTLPFFGRLKAQILTPVKWSFSSKKLSGNLFELHMTAKVDEGWKIYSQNTPALGPLPTKVTYNKNPQLLLGGKVKELGKQETVYEDVFKVSVRYYRMEVDFVQIVKLKNSAITEITGKIQFMACNDTMCLPPCEVTFNVDLK